MILIDTHIWIWWQTESPQLPVAYHDILTTPDTEIGVSIFSCWEVAKLAEYGKIVLDRPVLDWVRQALAQPGIRLIPLTPEIVVESTRLPGAFHRDPADQLIVATARILDCPLMTLDTKIQAYPFVKLFSEQNSGS